MKKIIYIFSFVSLFIYSCGEPTEPPSDQENLEAIEANRATIKMDMDENLLLTLSIKNFSQPLNFLSFTLFYNYNIFSISNVSGGDFAMDFSSENYNIEDEYLSFLFTGVSGSGDLLKIQLNGSSYQGTTIYIHNITLIDDSNQEWIYEYDSFYMEPICYISEHPTNGEQVFDDGEYGWTNLFCLPIQNDWRGI